MSIPFIEENDQTQVRRQHLDELRRLVGNVYPNKFERSRTTGGEDTITAIVESEEFKRHVPQVQEGERPASEVIERANAELNRVKVRISGRISSPPRVMGKAAFVHLSDGVSRLQIYVRKADVKGIHNDDGAPIEEGWELFNLLDHGDFIGASGYLFITKTGELSVHVETIQFLAKAMLPMPDKLHGLTDPEIRQRQRYADLIAGSLKVDKSEDGDASVASRELSSREVFERRSKIIREMRRFLDDHGYIEVETPMLTEKATGAAAKPFETKHNALGIKLYARIAPELYLKRLLVGGFEKVYELNRNFRNEGIDRTHNPEFTMLEFYCTYMDVNGMMDFCEELLGTVVEKIFGSRRISLGGEQIKFRKEDGTYSGETNEQTLAKTIKPVPAKRELDFGRPFPRLSMKEAIIKYWHNHDDYAFSKVEDVEGEIGLDWLNDPKQVNLLYEFRSRYDDYQPNAEEAVKELGLDLDNNKHLVTLHVWQAVKKASANLTSEPQDDEMARQIAFLFEDIAEKNLGKGHPVFITDFPKPISPLSKASPVNSAIAERFELFIEGMECANGFSELNDPEEQLKRFEEQAQQRERGDEEAMVLDEDYIRALSYGMPPAAGIGIGIDRLVMLLTNKRSIRDVILFPHMRPERKTEEGGEESQETG